MTRLSSKMGTTIWPVWSEVRHGQGPRDQLRGEDALAEDAPGGTATDVVARLGDRLAVGVADDPVEGRLAVGGDLDGLGEATAVVEEDLIDEASV
jgi:hypothetical protein